MKKKIVSVSFAFAMLLAMLSACESNTNTGLDSSSSGDATEISNEICAAIDDSISAFFDSYGYDDVIVTVLAFDDGLDIGLSCHGMVLQVSFADYANAVVTEAQSLAQEYDVDINCISVAFTRGEDEITSWRTYDCSVGTLLDSYDDSKILLTGQTIDDLIERYGAINLFCELLPTEAPDSESSITSALDPTDTTSSTSTAVPAPTPAATPKPTPAPTPIPTPTPTPAPQADTTTTGQKNAVAKAKDYLSIMAFSYDGLIAQLEFEGFTTSEATYGADNCGADWNEQAAKKAESYLSISAFSKDGLISQLEYEGFTHEQAVYGVTAAGY